MDKECKEEKANASLGAIHESPLRVFTACAVGARLIAPLRLTNVKMQFAFSLPPV